jgi:hypothetical protein
MTERAPGDSPLKKSFGSADSSKFSAQESLPDFCKLVRYVADEKLHVRPEVALITQAAFIQQTYNLFSSRLGGIDKLNTLPDGFFNDAPEKRIMSTPEYKRVNFLKFQGKQVFFRDKVRRFVISPSFLGKRHEQRTGLSNNNSRRIGLAY